MRELILIKHENLTNLYLDLICEIKQTAWNYSIAEQKEWIKKNICINDIHVLLRADENYVAYLNMIQLNLSINKLSFNGIGLANVCSSIKKKGFGSELIKEVNCYLINKNKIGLLFCKDNLIKFYEKNHWVLINKGNLKSIDIAHNIHIMIFNYIGDVDCLEYNGVLF
jgi:hypothetical protein